MPEWIADGIMIAIIIGLIGYFLWNVDWGDWPDDDWENWHK
jgi:hypothetical protein